jgi:hypothetical protein
VQGKLVAADASASTLEEAIEDYYDDEISSGISVNMTMYDINGTETTNTTEATTYVYYVILKELINDMSVTSISVVKAST